MVAAIFRERLFRQKRELGECTQHNHELYCTCVLSMFSTLFQVKVHGARKLQHKTTATLSLSAGDCIAWLRRRRSHYNRLDKL